MLIQLLADITRNKKLLGELINSPEKTLKKYPGVTKKQAQLLKKRDLPSITASVNDEVAKHFSQSRYSVLYIGVHLNFDSLTPESHKANDKVALTMVLKLVQAPLDPGKLASSVVFNHRSDAVKAKVTSTVYNKRNATVTIKMTAKFPKTGSYNANATIWVAGSPKEHTGLTTGNIFKVTTC